MLPHPHTRVSRSLAVGGWARHSSAQALLWGCVFREAAALGEWDQAAVAVIENPDPVRSVAPPPPRPTALAEVSPSRTGMASWKHRHLSCYSLRESDSPICSGCACRRVDKLRQLVVALCGAGELRRLVELPLGDLSPEVSMPTLRAHPTTACTLPRTTTHLGNQLHKPRVRARVHSSNACVSTTAVTAQHIAVLLTFACCPLFRPVCRRCPLATVRPPDHGVNRWPRC